ncbi:MAG TPA: hypothetical protein V6C69_10770 [Trichormus sp.]|jgi:hypothetical protein
MRKSVLLSLMAAVCVVSIMPSSYAATSSSSSGGMGDKMKNGAKSVGHAMAWPFKKMGAGFKAIGNKMHGGGSSAPKKSSP